MMYTTFGIVAGFFISVIALVLLIKHDEDNMEWNRQHKRHPQQRQQLFKSGLTAYFIIWTIASLYSWYFLGIIELGKFFAIAVILPALGASGFKLFVS